MRCVRQGGGICILPGEYKENVKISGASQPISIRGCGSFSKIVAAGLAPVFQVLDSSQIRIESLAIEHKQGAGVVVEAVSTQVRNVTLAALSITAAGSHGSGIELRSGVEHRVGEVTIRDCHITMNDLAGPWPGVFVVGDEVCIAKNVIEVPLDAVPQIKPVFAGRGGLQIGGTSDGVLVTDNLIRGGIGNGITLGSLEQVDHQGNVIEHFVPWALDTHDPDKPGDTYVQPGDYAYESPGFLYDIRIHGNRILNMGLNGIGVVGFFNVKESEELITIVGLEIADNEIRGCLQRKLAPIDAELVDIMGYGGIALADVASLRIRNNIIQDNGVGYLEPLSGIFVLHGEGIEIAANRILHNGTQTTQSESVAPPGQRGGISIVYSVAPMAAVSTMLANNAPRQNGLPALMVRDNTVTVRMGRALSATALGPVAVHGNQFTSRGILQSELLSPQPSFIGSTVSIVNLGVSNELYGQLVLFSALRRGRLKLGDIGLRVIDDIVHMRAPGPRLTGQDQLGLYLANGNVLFSNNQCVLDLLEGGTSLSMSSIYIVSLDDITVHDNECDCSVLDDFVIAQVILLGFSLRASDNRFKEGLANATFSAITLGAMNMTTNNQATHCLVVLPLAAVYPYTRDSLNTTLMCMPENAVTRLLEWVTRPFMEMTKLVLSL
jgi:hypothetical protein